MKQLTPEDLAKSGTEAAHQTALFCWMALNFTKYPELKLAFHIPNGGSRNKIEAARFKAQGVKAGVPDIFLPVARHNCHGLFIELKNHKGKTSDLQDEWIDNLRLHGYGACSLIGWKAARDVLIQYLS